MRQPKSEFRASSQAPIAPKPLLGVLPFEDPAKRDRRSPAGELLRAPGHTRPARRRGVRGHRQPPRRDPSVVRWPRPDRALVVMPLRCAVGAERRRGGSRSDGTDSILDPKVANKWLVAMSGPIARTPTWPLTWCFGGAEGTRTPDPLHAMRNFVSSIRAGQTLNRRLTCTNSSRAPSFVVHATPEMTGSLGTLGHARARNGGLCEARCDLGSVADDWTEDLESKAPSMCPAAQ
jgi:hypothetical protein